MNRKINDWVALGNSNAENHKPGWNAFKGKKGFQPVLSGQINTPTAGQLLAFSKANPDLYIEINADGISISTQETYDEYLAKEKRVRDETPPPTSPVSFDEALELGYSYPEYVSPRALQFGRDLYAALPDDLRQQILQHIPSFAGTADDGREEIRAFVALDWVVRGHTPALLDAAGLHEDATSLRSLPGIVDEASELAAERTVRAAYDKVGAALREEEDFHVRDTLNWDMDVSRTATRNTALAAAHATSDGGWGPGQRRADLAIKVGDMASALACYDSSNVEALRMVTRRSQESSIDLLVRMANPPRL